MIWIVIFGCLFGGAIVLGYVVQKALLAYERRHPHKEDDGDDKE